MMRSSVKSIKKNLTKTPAFSFVNKVYPNAQAALEGLEDGMGIGIGGFGTCGLPETLTHAVLERGTKELTIYSNDCSIPGFGHGSYVASKQMKRWVGSFMGENKDLVKAYLAGEMECDIVPQGTLAEQLRSGAFGIPAFYTPTGAGTWFEQGKMVIKYNKDGSVAEYSPKREVREFNGKRYLLIPTLRPDFCFVKAHQADTKGNLIHRLTARNFNVDMARAGKMTIAEAEHIVEAGELEADYIHTPSIYVDRIIEATMNEKRVQKHTFFTEEHTIEISGQVHDEEKREMITRRAAKEITDGMNINLGIGIPTLIPNWVEEDVDVQIQSENGLLGMGPYPMLEDVDPDLINAGKETVTLSTGAVTIPSSDTFGMIRGAHLDITFLGGLEVAANGDLASWMIPGKMVRGMGGAMDLVSAGNRVVVCMHHQNRKGQAKVVQNCSIPITGPQVVSRLITDMAVFDFPNGEITLVEIAPGLTLDDVKAATDCEFKVADDIKEMDIE
mmetsp:Transcript_14500/g.16021  ORF Transcript_14500/g.16021 Transcript_14500/m.16021 type:complete len:501 (+) Transcript_14500:241-1743(+)|eukprot:CAMPEP_0114999596 /NCGR_PEP_ID=MMETSP0216-20121206/16240_1 /TAXON_ID=223996 /ORGANISM="Protocruzia adherens, Strain Boccale" /LENGTH=500 /DNA_ID=CAMNT_0002364501 /DNA_START=121 /DNA_END=1623 /DNA_ORIENTATION=+